MTISIKLACGHTMAADEMDGGMDEMDNVTRRTLEYAVTAKVLRHAITGCDDER